MKHTIWTRGVLLALCMLLLVCMMTLGTMAAEQTTEQVTEQATEQVTEQTTEEDLGGFFSAKRIKYAASVTVQGMLMIFSVLALLWGVVAIFKVVLHDIPEKRAAKKQALAAAVAEAVVPTEQPEQIAPVPEEDDGEIVAAITAAIAATLASEEYKDQFASGFRVVSFQRKGGAWNKEN